MISPQDYDVVSLTEHLIQIDSINPFVCAWDGKGTPQIEGKEDEIFAFCEAWLHACGFSVSYQDCGHGRRNLLAIRGDGPSSLLLYAHVDTVEVKQGWSRAEALTPRRDRLLVDGVEEEVLVGLGSNDMKGGIAVLLRAVAQASTTTHRLKLVLGCDEEFWSLGSHKLVSESDFLDDVVGVVVPEVGESCEASEPGSQLVTLGRCGRAEFVIEVPGTGGHGAEPDREDRVNAITQAATIALAVEAHSQSYKAFRPFPGLAQHVRSSALVTSIAGGDGALSVPDAATLVVNRVLVPGEDEASAKAELVALLQDLRDEGRIRPVHRAGQMIWPQVETRPRPTPPLLPYLTEPTQPFVQEVLACVESIGPVQWGMGVSVADENRFGGTAGKPVVVIGPRGELSHAAHEWVSIPSLRKLEAIYSAILRQF